MNIAKLRACGLYIVILCLVIGLCGCPHSEANGCRKLKKTDPVIVVIANQLLAKSKDPKRYKVSEVSEDGKYWRVYYYPVVEEGHKFAPMHPWMIIKINRDTCQAVGGRAI